MLPPSQRSTKNLERVRGNLVKIDISSKQPYDAKSNPDGFINVWGAKSGLMLDWVSDWTAKEFKDVDISQYFPYLNRNVQPVYNSLANIFNEHFKSAVPVQSEDIILTNGTTSLMNLLGYTLFDSGDVLLVPSPNFSGFQEGFSSRNEIELVIVPTDTDSQIKDQYLESSSDAVISAFERTYQAFPAKEKIKAILISNPNNPTGRCYSKESLQKLLDWTVERKLHFICDEIYGLGAYEQEGLDSFTSVLSLIEAESEAYKLANTHVFWGTSKDLGMGGLRAGFLATRNRELHEAIAPHASYIAGLTNFTLGLLERFLASPSFPTFISTHRARLQDSNQKISKALTENNIPFYQANSGLYFWLDLRHWLQYFKGPERSFRGKDGKVVESKEIALLRYLVDDANIYMCYGEDFFSNVEGHYRFVYTWSVDDSLIFVERLKKSLDRLVTVKPDVA